MWLKVRFGWLFLQQFFLLATLFQLCISLHITSYFIPYFTGTVCMVKWHCELSQMVHYQNQSRVDNFIEASISGQQHFDCFWFLLLLLKFLAEFLLRNLVLLLTRSKLWQVGWQWTEFTVTNASSMWINIFDHTEKHIFFLKYEFQKQQQKMKEKNFNAQNRIFIWTKSQFIFLTCSMISNFILFHFI